MIASRTRTLPRFSPAVQDAKYISLHEVALRDGLQMEKEPVPLAQKIRWAEMLIDSGVDTIQLGSFVHPGRVPQMSDTDALFQHFREKNGDAPATTFSALVLNEKGLERGLACGVEMFCMGVSASETHSRKNTGMSVAEATTRIIAMAQRAVAAGKNVQLSVQSAFGCGYEGAVPPENVIRIVDEYLESGFRTISLADTAGLGTPQQVRSLFAKVISRAPGVQCTAHFHNTYGLGMANCCAAIETGVTCFESSVGGLGGCPFTRVAGGNLCTEDLVHYLQRTEQRRDVRIGKLIELARALSRYFQRELPGMIHKIPGIEATSL